MIDPWTSQPAVIEIVNELFETTSRLVEKPAGEAAPTPSIKQARSQLPELASVLFASYAEWISWLGRFVDYV